MERPKRTCTLVPFVDKSSNSNKAHSATEPPNKKRKIITQKGRALIVNVYKFLKEEYIFTMMHKDCSCDLSHLRNISRRTADATNVSLRTVAQVLAEHRQTNTPKEEKVYKFKKAKSISITEDAEKIRQELELKETAILAEAGRSHFTEENVEVKLGPIIIKKNIDTEDTWQPAEVKTEIEEEDFKWEEVEVKTDIEEEIHWKEVEVKTEVEEKDTYLEEVDIKEEAIDYEITIEDERIGY